VVLPGAAYTEKAGTYVNFEGRVQATRPAVPLVGDARDDWKILRAVSEVVGAPLPYDSREQLLSRLADVAPHLGRRKVVEAPVWLNGQYIKALQSLRGAGSSSKGGGSSSDVLRTTIDNFFMTDAISRASQTMAKCVQARQQQQQLKA
jgi:NADH dehydrogenase (ubiquinone) Fe-S protein 1